MTAFAHTVGLALLAVLAVGPATVSAQPVLSADELVEGLETPPGLKHKAFSANYKPDAVTGRCQGDEQAGGTARRDLAVVPRVGSVEVAVNVPFQFGHDKHELTDRDRQQADELAKALNSSQLADRSFSITGHTDATGPAEHNRRLSCARAIAVREHLKARNVDPRRLSTYGFGATKPVVPNDPKNEANRRVEVINVEAFQP